MVSVLMMSLGAQAEAQTGLKPDLQGFRGTDAERLRIGRICKVIDQARIEIESDRRDEPVLHAYAGHSGELKAGNLTFSDVAAVHVPGSHALFDGSSQRDIDI